MLILIGIILILIGQVIKLNNIIKNLNEANRKLKEQNNQLSGYPIRSNYEQDISFLIYLINKKIQNYLYFIIKPSQITISRYIKDDQFEEWKESIMSDVLNSLSPMYIKLLQGYFSKDGLDDYICEYINYELTKIVLEENFK